MSPSSSKINLCQFSRRKKRMGLLYLPDKSPHVIGHIFLRDRADVLGSSQTKSGRILYFSTCVVVLQISTHSCCRGWCNGGAMVAWRG